jgi:hypothetical protein
MNYIDKYGRIHDAPSMNGESSSDNGWLYSAVAKRAGFPLQLNQDVAQHAAETLQRHPPTVTNRPFVPISRDEILGLAYLGYLKPHHLEGWNFSPEPLPRFNPIKLIQQLWRIRKEHRTYFWRNGLTQVNHVAYMVPLQDRHFLLQCWGKYNAFYHLIHIIDSAIPKSDRSSRNMRFLKTGKDIGGVINYFGPNHPLSKYVQDKLNGKI